MASTEMLNDLSVGALVSVDGSVAGAGWLYADSVSVSPDRYVPGATEVFVTGMISELDQGIGQARVGELTVDYTPALGAGGLPTTPMVTFRGIQPSERGLLVSSEAFAVAQ